MQRIVVLLPEPFGPRKPVTRPGCTSKLRSSTASTRPKRFVKLADLDQSGLRLVIDDAESERVRRPAMIERTVLMIHSVEDSLVH